MKITSRILKLLSINVLVPRSPTVSSLRQKNTKRPEMNRLEMSSVHVPRYIYISRQMF